MSLKILATIYYSFSVTLCHRKMMLEKPKKEKYTVFFFCFVRSMFGVRSMWFACEYMESPPDASTYTAYNKWKEVLFFFILILSTLFGTVLSIGDCLVRKTFLRHQQPGPFKLKMRRIFQRARLYFSIGMRPSSFTLKTYCLSVCWCAHGRVRSFRCVWARARMCWNDFFSVFFFFWESNQNVPRWASVGWDGRIGRFLLMFDAVFFLYPFGRGSGFGCLKTNMITTNFHTSIDVSLLRALKSIKMRLLTNWKRLITQMAGEEWIICSGVLFDEFSVWFNFNRKEKKCSSYQRQAGKKNSTLIEVSQRNGGRDLFGRLSRSVSHFHSFILCSSPFRRLFVSDRCFCVCSAAIEIPMVFCCIYVDQSN